MNTKMHGKAVAYIELDPAWTMHGNPERIVAGGNITLTLSATHHGDHDQFWIVMAERGQEIARYSHRAVQHIRWSPESEL